VTETMLDSAREPVVPQSKSVPPATGVSIFFPCYNDWGTMAGMVMMTLRTARELGVDFDLTVVDDGSGPHTLEVLDEIRRTFPEVRVIEHGRNRGYGGALRSGFAAAEREWIFYTDGDAQYDVRELRVLLEHAGDAVDVVQGYKITRHDPLYRILIGRIYHWIVKFAFGLRLRDVDCDFRLLRRSIFDTIELTRDSGVICAEMMTKIQRAGFRVVEVPVNHYQRAHGKSQFFNFPRVARVGWNLAGLWIETFVLRKPVGKDSGTS
jgi:glycosyltransferase involved in cell wall biosynthesis